MCDMECMHLQSLGMGVHVWSTEKSWWCSQGIIKGKNIKLVMKSNDMIE